MQRLAILSGGGALPAALAAAYPEALRIVFDDVPHQMPAPVEQHSLNRMGGLFDTLRAGGASDLVLAGAMGRPALNPAEFDAGMMAIAPRLLPAMQSGDDGILRLMIAVFEEQGFCVRGAHELLPELTVPEGLFGGPVPTDAALADASRAFDILLALSPLDVGQGAVVSAGLCLGVETLQGTDAMLRFVGETPEALRRGRGVLVKAPKRGQDLRVDMPAIGPDTVRNAAAAGLEGIVVSAGRVLLLQADETRRALDETRLFLLGRVL